MVAFRVIKVISMIAAAALIVQITSTLPWQVDALIAGVVVIVWAYIFENENGNTTEHGCG